MLLMNNKESQASVMLRYLTVHQISIVAMMKYDVA